MFFQVLVNVAFASSVLVQAPNSNDNEYLVFSENSASVRPSELKEECLQSAQLQSYFLKANDHYINGSMENSKNFYKKVINMKWDCDWDGKQRGIIQWSYLRLAQVSNTQADTDHFLQELVDFDESIPPDASAFPPPVIEKYIKIKAETARMNFNTESFPVYAKILRNGKPLGKGSVRIPTNTARFSFLSDSHHPVFKVLRSDDLYKMDIFSSPFVTGSCKDFHFSKPGKWFQDAEIFFSPDCIVDRPQNSLAAAIPSFKETNVVSNPIEMQLQQDARTHRPTWIERNYIWVGTAIVGALVISAEMNKRKEQTVITPSNSLQKN
jgi:hypothetical protein